MFALQKKRTILFATFVLLTLFLPIHGTSKKNQLSPSRQEAHAIGQKLWQNECNKSVAGLTSWNKGEAFASLGIGHFIWFPRNCSAPFTQTFPSLLIFLKKHGVTLPAWLEACSYCPWSSREEFIAAADSVHMRELRTLLSATVDLQVLFIVDRMQKALPAMLKNRSGRSKRHIKKQFYRVANCSNGLYVLIDYINFKGEGTNVQERYNGQGWGLVQVLERMGNACEDKNPLSTNLSNKDLSKKNLSDENPVEEFTQAASEVLRMRVQNAPNKEVEQRFLPGWLNRIKTYMQVT